MPPQEHLERRLAAIFAADVAGYSRLMRADEAGTMRALTAHRGVMDSLIAEHRGRIANTAGDSVLAEFPSVVDAVKCAIEVQEAIARNDEAEAEERRLTFRVGVHVGDVIVRGNDVIGDAVNVAARLQSLAEAGGICLSAIAHEYVRNVLPLNFDDLGTQPVKNISEPIRAYAIRAANRTAELPLSSGSRASALAQPDKPSLAVLPFSTTEAEEEYLAEGVCDDIITALYKMRWLFVIARTSTFPLKGRAIDVTQIARQLGVAYILSGSVRRSGNRVRISAQLVEGETGGSLWAERYDRDLTDIFALQDEIAERVAAAIEPELLRKEGQRVAARPVQNLTAWDLVRRGTWEFHKITPETACIARDLFLRAIKAEPNSADGHLWLARTDGQILAYYGSDDRQKTLNEGVNAALRAVQLDDKNPYCHYAVAITHTFAGQFDAATEAAQRSVALCPSFALGHFGLSHARVFAGRPKEAIDALEHGLRLNPFDPQGFAWHLTSAISYFFVGRPEKGLDHARRALSLRPHWAPALMLVTLCAAELGDIPRAKAALKEMDTTGDARVGVLGEVLTYNPRWDDHVRQTMAAVRADLVETSAARMSE